MKQSASLNELGVMGGKESLSNTNEQQHCQHSTTNTYCIGNGQVHDAMTPSPVCKTLNTMDDPMKIMTVSQDAYDKFSENDKSASLKASGGTYGGERSSCNTIGSLCARDYKGVGNQYVDEGKCIVSSICFGKSSS